MLEFSYQDHILEVKETLLSYSRTKVSYWYYDTNVWMKSSHGRQGDTPDREMTPEDIEWVKKHYLPKVTKQADLSQGSPSAFDPKAKARYAAVSASMEKDDYYAKHSREECGVEWRRRYDALKAADQKPQH